MERHRITNADRQALLGDCSVCGPQVPIRWMQNQGNYYCPGRKKNYSAVRRGPYVRLRDTWHRVTEIDEENKEGYCGTCDNWVAIYRDSNKRWLCGVARREREILLKYNQEVLDIWRNRTICEGCGTDELLGIDHCHEKEIFRGILCRKCNAALGMVNDNLEVLEKLVTYLRRSKEMES